MISWILIIAVSFVAFWVGAGLASFFVVGLMVKALEKYDEEFYEKLKERDSW